MIKGALVPNITIFTREGEVDLKKTENHMRWMFDRGVHGLFLTGSYGAGPLMSIEERIKIYELAKKVVKDYPDCYLIAHVGCADTKSTIQLAIEADKIGVQGISAVPPFYYKYESDMIVSFYKDIIQSVDSPVYAYNNPVTTRYTFSIDTVKKLQNLGLKGIKDSSMNVEFLSTVFYDAKINEKNFQVIIGTSTGWLPFFYMGIDTMIAGMCNYAPEIISYMYEKTINGDKENSEKAYDVMMKLSKKIKFIDSTIASHIALKARGFDAGYPRLPMILPEDDMLVTKVKNDIKEAFDMLNITYE